MAELDVMSRDYVPQSLQVGMTASVVQAALIRLATPKGSYWRDPALGSELYRLRQAKDVPRVLGDAKRYAEQALAPLLAAKRIRALAVTVQQDRPMWLRIWVDLTLLDHRVQRVTHFVPVGG